MGSYLYSSPSFWSGVSRLLDLGNTYDQYNQSQTEKDADSVGIFMDWDAVGQDLWVTFQSEDAQLYRKSIDDHRTAQVVGR